MKTLPRKLPAGCVVAFACLLAAGQANSQNSPPVPNRITQIPENSAQVTLKGGVHPLARAEFSRGAVADSLPMDRILLLLKRSEEQEAALQSLLEAQQDKSSPNYHQWLSPEDFGKQFGPSDADLQAVTGWLTSQGFHDVHVGPGRSVIEFSGSAAQVRQAFSTQIQNYAVNGAVYVANSTDPQIPAALAPVISGIVSLHNFPKKSHSKFLGSVRKAPNSNKLEPLFTFPNPNGSGLTFYGVGPGDFATIYNSKTLLGGGTDGTGQTIAIVGETQIDPTDVSDFRTMFGLSNNFSSTNVIVNGMDPGITSQDEESESDLDVQWSGAVAPGATVKFVVSASTPASAGIDLSALYIIEHNLADVMSESYGDCEADLGSAGNAFYSALWEQAAAQGITVVVSSGDSGSAGCDDFSANPPVPASHGLAVSGIAGTPFNVSVGGTDFDQFNVWPSYWSATNDSATGTSALKYIPEIPWNENCAQLGLTGCGSTAPGGSVNIVAGSGGPSKVYAKPSWQMGVSGVPNDNHRDQPDISLFASPGFTGSAYLYCQKDLTFISTCNLNSAGITFQAIGGTSASAPAFAGVMALVNQYAAAHGGSARQGNPNPVLYALAKKSGASCTSSASEAAGCIFNDIAGGNTFLATKYGKSVGTNSVPCKGGTLNCSSTVASTKGVLVDPSHTTTEAWTAAAGYDMATGLGTVNINNLATNWGSVSTIGTTTTLSLAPTTGITHGSSENVSVNVNVTPKTGTGIPAGDVSLLATLADGSTLGLDQFTLTNGAISGLKTQSLPGGTYQVYAHYAGDGTNAPSDSPSVQVTVGKESSQTFIVVPSFDSQGNQTSGNASSVTYGSNYIIRMYVANSSAVASPAGAPSNTCENVNAVACPTGTVALSANGSPVDGGIYTLNNIGYTRDIAPTLTGGTYPLVAKYSGDSSYTASTSSTATLTVNPAPTRMLPPNPPLPSTITTPYGVGAIMTMDFTGGVAPSCNVTILDGANALPGPANCFWQANGPFFYVSEIVSQTTSGTHTYTVKFNGDANYAPSTSAPMTTRAFNGTTISITASPTSVQYGSPVTLTAVVDTALAQGPALSNAVTFSSGAGAVSGTVTYTPIKDSSGNIALQATINATPQNRFTFYSASFAGDANYGNSGSNLAFVNVNIPDFSLGPSSGLTVMPAVGQAGSGQITITPATNTPSTVTLSFNGAPAIAGYSLSISPQQVNLNGSPTTATLTLTPNGGAPAPAARRNAQHAAILFPSFTSGTPWKFGALGLAALLVFLCKRRKFRLAAGFAAAGIAAFALGCGGGGSGGGGGGGGGSNPTPTSITLTTSAAKAGQSDTIVLAAAVTASKPMSGTVSFYDYGNLISSGYAVTNGQAQLQVSGIFFGLGVHQITAKYSGDANNLASTTAASLTETVTGSTNVTIMGATGDDLHTLNATIGVQ